MPKLVEMTQLSRPFQIALIAVGLLAAVWLFALQGHPASTSSPVVTPTPAAPSSNAGTPSTVYHGSAPGVGGLTRAIAKAHGAVATSQQNAKQLEERSAQASNASTGGVAPSASSAPSRTATPTSSPVRAPASKSTGHAPAAISTPSASAPATVVHHPIKAQAGAGRTPARQALVERALHEGKIAVILFWSPKGTDDVAVRDELRLLEAAHHLIAPLAGVAKVRLALERSGLELQKKFAAFEARANQVASFGSITRGIQVYGTPTILIINKRGQTTTLTGLQDAFAIEQAIDEARHS